MQINQGLGLGLDTPLNLGSLMWSFIAFFAVHSHLHSAICKKEKTSNNESQHAMTKKEGNLIQYSQAFKKLCSLQESHDEKDVKSNYDDGLKTKF